MLRAKEFFMESVRVIGMCVLLAGQMALAQTVARSDDAPAAELPRAGTSARRSTRARRHLTPQQQTQTSPEQVLYAFQGGSDGAYPTGNLIFDSTGNLYGVTGSGGAGGSGNCSSEYGGPGCGTVYELSPSATGGWTKTTLYAFQPQNDGAFPAAGLIFDGAGNLYGTTYRGGTGTCQPDGCGTVFELSPNGSGGWAETVLYSFQGGSTDGNGPWALIFDRSGNLYGTTFGGGTGNPSECGVYQECGTVFELSPNGSGGWAEKIIYNFQGKSDGAYPSPGLAFDASGNLYGTASQGGDSYGGTAFKLSPIGGGGWSETTLHAFSVNGSDGYQPETGVIFDVSGNLWGTTFQGESTGLCKSSPWEGSCGTVFELTPNGSGGWTESLPFDFPTDGSAGANPSGVIFDRSGNLYGTTPYGADASCDFGESLCPGLVFELSPAASGTLAQTFLYAFQGGSDGMTPDSGVVLDQAGHLYGVAAGGAGIGCGGYPCGLVYQVSIGAFALFSPAALGYADQTLNFASPSQNVTLTNNGNRPMTISSVQITGANANEFGQQNNCPATLAVNTSCAVSVTFLPTVQGSASASLTVTDNAASSPQSVPLTGTGVIDVTFSPTTVTFPSQYVGTAGLPQAVTLTNNTNNAIAIKSVAASPGDFAALNSCPDTLQPGGYCTVGVFFDPTTSGTRNGTLTVTDTAPTGQQTVMLTGTGEDFAMMAGSPSASVTPGEMAKYTVEVAPTGGFAQTVALSCTGAPLEASCSVSPSSVKLGGSEAEPVTITVATAGGSAGMAYGYPAGFSRRGMLAMWLALAGLPGVVLVGGARKRRWLLGAVVVLCLVSGMVMWTACGGGGMGSGTSSSTGNGNGGATGGGTSTPAGSYNLTVVGTFSSGSANLVHSTKLVLVVK
jgi:uncharacterized repeat protein (TIGR03803 family)